MPAPKDPEKRALWLARLSESHKGHKHTEEQKRKIGEASRRTKTGVPRPDMQGDRNPMRRPEVAAKVGAAHAGKPKPPEQIAKIRQTMTGRRLTPEHREALQKADAGYKAVHRRLDTLHGKIKTQTCTHCGGDAAHWAILHGRGTTALWGGLMRRWSHDPADYIPLCVSCHRRYDASP